MTEVGISVTRIRLFGMALDAVTMSEAVARVLGWVDEPDGTLRYVVTPNVHHTLMFQERADLRAVYADASLVLVDGMPLVVAARLLGRPVPGRVAGSDLAPALLAAGQARGHLSVFLLGGETGVAEQAARNIARQYPAVRVTDCYSPPFGFERDAEECARIVDRVNRSGADVLIVGLGAPKQELWTHRFRHELRVPVALCVGATIDFIADHKPRAPAWVRRSGLEWVHRLMSEPGRLAGRYARDALRFPGLFLREWLERDSLKTDRT